MNIAFLGNGSRGEVCKQALLEAGHSLVDNINECELIVMAGYNRILPKDVFSRPKYGAINCHAGRLPKYRGSSVLNWAIINGETVGSANIIQVDEGIDTGDVLFERGFLIRDRDTIATVRETVNKIFAELLPEVVYKISIGAVSPIPQGGGEYWHHRQPADSRIIWGEMTAKQVYDLVRASEYPYCAWTDFVWKVYGITNNYAYADVPRARLLTSSYHGIPGRVVGKVDDGVIVIAADRGIWIDAELSVGSQLY